MVSGADAFPPPPRSPPPDAPPNPAKQQKPKKTGWGTSFHFAHRYSWETHQESIKRHEHYLALKLGLKRGHKVLDVGCGVGGPLREVALFSGAHVTGINNNAYQISRALHHNARMGHGLTETCGFVKADFMKMPFEVRS